MTFRVTPFWLPAIVATGLVCAVQTSVAHGQVRRQQAHVLKRVQQAAAPVVRQPPPQPPPAVVARPSPVEHGIPETGRRVPDTGHLGQWMNQHSGLTPAQQQQALQREPGFRELPPQTQQRYMDRLAELNAMPAGERQKMLARNEWMEHLNPDQRAQVRGATEELGALPPNQRGVVARSFRELRELPPNQRMAAMNADRYRQLNPAQREALGSLLRVAPLMPPAEARVGPPRD
jgi:hypothetical protein